MYGANKITKQDRSHDGQMLRVKEVFHSIQGEGPHAGEPAVFIRLAGCNLRCWFCDTDFDHRAEVELVSTIAGVVNTFRKQHPNTKRIVITGGEPFLQNLNPLIRALIKSGCMRTTFDIETAGTVEPIEPLVCRWMMTVICSPKTGKVHEAMKGLVTAWKYVVNYHDMIDDYFLMGETQPKDTGCLTTRAAPTNSAPVFISPMDEHHENTNALNIQYATKLCLEKGFRLSLQIHKIIGVE